MTLSYTHGREFVRQVRPILEAQDIESLIRYLRHYWPGQCLRGLLTCGYDEAVKAVLVCLWCTGTKADTRAVARLLHDDDGQMAALAEHALWSIWFRAGDDRANVHLMHAVRLLGRGRFDQAIKSLDALIGRCSTFAEAYNQRAIAHFLSGEYVCAISDGMQAVRLNEHHFGALAGLGHSYAALGRLDRALEAYRRSLELHPRLEGVRESIRQIRECIARSQASSHLQSFTP